MENNVTESPDFTIRESCPDDFAGIVSLLRRTGMENTERDGPLLSFGDGARIVAVLGRLVIGHIYTGDRNGIPVVEALVVDPEYRSRTIGSMLLTAYETYSVLNGRDRAELQIDEHRDDLLKFYEDRGYRATYRSIGMEKELDTSQRPYLSTPAAFRQIHRQTTQEYMHLYYPETVLTLQEKIRLARAKRINGLTLDTDTNSGFRLPANYPPQRMVIYVTPWCPSIANESELVRWGRVSVLDKINNSNSLLREIRAPITDSPPTDPKSEDIDAFGNYIVYHENTSRIEAFRVNSHERGAVLLRRDDEDPILEDLRYAARKRPKSKIDLGNRPPLVFYP